jgi:probable addiction module antidote protein
VNRLPATGASRQGFMGIYGIGHRHQAGQESVGASRNGKIATKSPAKTKTVPYEVAEQLRTPEEMAAYLDAWLTEAPDDAAGIARALGDIARARGMSQVASGAGLSRESLYKALRGAIPRRPERPR